MAAVKHQHRSARALVLALRDHQVLVVDLGGPAGALHCVQNCGGGVEVHRVAELIGLGRAAGIDAGGEIAGVMPAGAGVARGPEQVPQRLVAEKVQGLVGDFEPHLARLAFADPAALRSPRLFARQVGWRRNVARLRHPVHDRLDELLELVAHLLLGAVRLVAEELLEQVLRQHAAAEQRFENCVVQRLHRPIPIIGRVSRAPEPAREQQIRELRHELVHVEIVQQVGHVFRVGVFHGREA